MIHSDGATEMTISLLQACASARLGSWTLDRYKDTIYLSAQFCQLLGLEDGDREMDYQLFMSKHIHPEDVWFVQEYQRAPASRRYTFRVVSDSGMERWLEAFPTAEHDANTHRISGVVQDVTERMANEDGIQNARKMESVRSIAGGIAHEFNNILYAMSGYIGLLKEMASDEDIDRDEMREFLGEIEFGNKRAVRLIKKIQTFSHSGKQGVSPVSLNDAVAKALHGMPTPENIDVDTNLHDAPPVMVYAHQHTLEEGISNILVNAVGAMDLNGGTVAVRLEQRFIEESRTVQCGKLQTGYYGCVSIQDKGCGMDKNTISRIFEPFFTTKQAGRGTGLGLAIVFGMVNAAGGAVEVESQLGAGSTFRVYLPACSNVPKENSKNDAHSCN
ncbi:MAG: PAS domain S-box protein [Deltaproteobacteria bacterium]|nr:PAS domain S-box protein [Deltaproteobacteria bacterium]MBN2671784.1 PAS domain S-box protein [Deltaproteobacteria bacterium]